MRIWASRGVLGCPRVSWGIKTDRSWCLVIVVWLFFAVSWGFSAVCDCGIF